MTTLEKIRSELNHQNNLDVTGIEWRHILNPLLNTLEDEMNPSLASIRLTGNANGLANDDTIPFDGVLEDTDGFFDLENHKFVIPANMSGIYLVGIEVSVSGIPEGATYVMARALNTGSDNNVLAEIADAGKIGSSTGLRSLSEGDSVVPSMIFDTEGSINVTTSSAFWLVKIS